MEKFRTKRVAKRLIITSVIIILAVSVISLIVLSKAYNAAALLDTPQSANAGNDIENLSVIVKVLRALQITGFVSLILGIIGLFTAKK